MSLVTFLAEEGEHVVLPMPTWAYGAIAFTIFCLLGFVVYSFRDVYHRHSVPQNVGTQHPGATNTNTSDHSA